MTGTSTEMASSEVESEARLLRRVTSALDEAWSLLDDFIEQDQKVFAKNQINDELETKFAAELHLHNELKERLQEMNKSGSDLEKMCSRFENINIKESDQARLNNAQDMLNIGKDYTGIRWDYSAPPNLAKGYVKNNSKMMLECFELNTEGAESTTVTDKLWQYVGSAAATSWQDLVTNKVVDKENLKNN